MSTMRALAVAAAVAVGLLGASSANAQSSKNAMQMGKVAVLQPSALSAGPSEGWQTIFSTALHTSNPGDLQVGVSLEAGLFTDTLVRSKSGTSDTSKAEAMIEIQVLVDGKPADPGSVIFARRSQTVMAKFGGILQECTDADANGTIYADECLFTDEELQLILDTMNANSFFFGLADVGQGEHQISVQARIRTNATWQAGSAAASATIGKGSVVVEEVKYIKALEVTPAL
ncbi:MAG: hypothetical protein HY901_17140 [Deltaproteobacteria bacterium]|nr:hypothetical protein [Deltaproteobacteria bacterium]